VHLAITTIYLPYEEKAMYTIYTPNAAQRKQIEKDHPQHPGQSSYAFLSLAEGKAFFPNVPEDDWEVYELQELGPVNLMTISRATMDACRVRRSASTRRAVEQLKALLDECNSDPLLMELCRPDLKRIAEIILRDRATQQS